jgi:uncharacterized membrane protein
MRLKHIITAWLLLALLIAAGSVFATEEIDDEATPEAQVESSEAEATAEATEAVTGEGEFAESGEETDAAEADEADEADEAPAGIGLLFLLLGAGAIVAVGGTMIARENFRDRD